MQTDIPHFPADSPRNIERRDRAREGWLLRILERWAPLDISVITPTPPIFDQLCLCGPEVKDALADHRKETVRKG